MKEVSYQAYLLVLASLLVMIMISDKDSEVKESMIRCFANDTRVSKRIRSKEEKMQKELVMIYKVG